MVNLISFLDYMILKTQTQKSANQKKRENEIVLRTSTKHGNCVLHRRLRDQHRLEATSQSRVLLNILAILLDGGGTNAVQFTTGQLRLNQVGSIHRAAIDGIVISLEIDVNG
jgi:hypothetical protein